ncbi:hypothetical protein HK105_200818 [Polyrhizophydium stewartii]|uniref:RRM domain-containing protein n=1 Tax=Polyrhizophydium stewartii TaxID=2732419 RepID=A0ABR4NK63_9FUNG
MTPAAQPAGADAERHLRLPDPLALPLPLLDPSPLLPGRRFDSHHRLPLRAALSPTGGSFPAPAPASGHMPPLLSPQAAHIGAPAHFAFRPPPPDAAAAAADQASSPVALGFPHFGHPAFVSSSPSPSLSSLSSPHPSHQLPLDPYPEHLHSHQARSTSSSQPHPYLQHNPLQQPLYPQHPQVHGSFAQHQLHLSPPPAQLPHHHQQQQQSQQQPQQQQLLQAHAQALQHHHQQQPYQPGKRHMRNNSLNVSRRPSWPSENRAPGDQQTSPAQAHQSLPRHTSSAQFAAQPYPAPTATPSPPPNSGALSAAYLSPASTSSAPHVSAFADGTAAAAAHGSLRRHQYHQQSGSPRSHLDDYSHMAHQLGVIQEDQGVAHGRILRQTSPPPLQQFQPFMHHHHHPHQLHPMATLPHRHAAWSQLMPQSGSTRHHGRRSSSSVTSPTGAAPPMQLPLPDVPELSLSRLIRDTSPSRQRVTSPKPPAVADAESAMAGSVTTAADPPATDAAEPANADAAAPTAEETAAPKLSSLETLYRSRPNVPPNNEFAVVKLSNISWDLTTSDVQAFFSETPIPMRHVAPHYHHGIHIIMDRTTGKTLNECFVEFPTKALAQQALRLHRRGYLKGRPVNVEPSSQDELYRALFPSLMQSLQRRLEYRNQLTQPQPQLPHSQSQPQTAQSQTEPQPSQTHPQPSPRSLSRPQSQSSGHAPGASVSETPPRDPELAAAQEHPRSVAPGEIQEPSPKLESLPKPGPSPKIEPPMAWQPLAESEPSSTEDTQAGEPGLVFMAREDVFTLLSSCKPSRQTHPSRRSPRRPFENIMSILSKVPWHRTCLVPILQRDHLFEMAKLGTESLRFQLQRQNSTLDLHFLEAYVRACLCVPLFTEKQKQIVISTARMECPEDLRCFVEMPPEDREGAPPGDSESSMHGAGRMQLELKAMLAEVTGAGAPATQRARSMSFSESHSRSASFVLPPPLSMQHRLASPVLSAPTSPAANMLMESPMFLHSTAPGSVTGQPPSMLSHGYQGHHGGMLRLGYRMPGAITVADADPAAAKLHQGEQDQMAQFADLSASIQQELQTLRGEHQSLLDYTRQLKRNYDRLRQATAGYYSFSQFSEAPSLGTEDISISRTVSSSSSSSKLIGPGGGGGGAPSSGLGTARAVGAVGSGIPRASSATGSLTAPIGSSLSTTSSSLGREGLGFDFGPEGGIGFAFGSGLADSLLDFSSAYGDGSGADTLSRRR